MEIASGISKSMPERLVIAKVRHYSVHMSRDKDVFPPRLMMCSGIWKDRWKIRVGSSC